MGSDDPTSHTLAGITRRLRFVIIRVGMHDNAAPQDFFKRYPFHVSTQPGFTLSIGQQIGHIAAMPVIAIVMAVRLGRRVVMPLGATGVRRTAITHFMNMKTMFAWRQPGELRLDTQYATLLAESHVPGYRATRAGRHRSTGRRPGEAGGTSAEQASGEHANG